MPAIEEGENSNEKMAILAYETYKIVRNGIMSITQNNSWMGEKSKLILVGGIMINMDGKAHDLFIPLDFEAISKDGSIQDLMKENFGEEAASLAEARTLDECAEGTYRDESSRKCKACHESCASCKSANTCEKCAEGYQTHEKTMSGFCLKCPVNNYLEGNSCKACPHATFYHEKAKKCSNCPWNCVSCTGYNSCIKCSSGFSVNSKATSSSDACVKDDKGEEKPDPKEEEPKETPPNKETIALLNKLHDKVNA